MGRVDLHARVNNKVELDILQQIVFDSTSCAHDVIISVQCLVQTFNCMF